MESTGAKLKKLRLEKGITLDEVHKKTKIHLDILKAIEEDSFINLSPIYKKGFLKIYCKFLGLNPKDFIPDYKEPPVKVRPISDTQAKPVSLFKRVPLRLVYLKSVYTKKIVFIIILITIFIIGLFNIGKFISTRKTRLPAAKIEGKAKIADKTKAPAIMPKVRHPEVTPQRDTTFGIRLSILAREDCWIQLRTDGRIVFQRILKKGRSESWQAKDKIELSLGNAGAVDLEVNGKLISKLGRRGQVLKNILITKEGINIGR